MKHLVLGFVLLFLASVSTAQAQTDWRTLLTKSGSKVTAVEGATTIDVGTAKSLHDRGVTFIDSRSTRRWKQGHIPGASSLYAITEAALMEIVGKDEEVVFYCGGTDCSLSPNACARALTWGLDRTGRQNPRKSRPGTTSVRVGTLAQRFIGPGGSGHRSAVSARSVHRMRTDSTNRIRPPASH